MKVLKAQSYADQDVKAYVQAKLITCKNDKLVPKEVTLLLQTETWL